ncbi:lipocalin-like domain-containing protein [Leptospira ilyithenensis]|uniref:Carotenoid 1,2-hydratase n=1 Tax=Leptospira ilyithenensis TaxID=2484901 RepID=A0A4R9LLC6_9LEPT|nr:lipocalin-like domain-containing protein [Leptospira ilyithenensis]TGN06569.1 carotenoid 1,2-hydratase [Leptospira ilyithenensis]
MKNRFLILTYLFFNLAAFKFPEDHNFHGDYGIEWCYFVGHLVTTENLKFGYELSFFKVTLKDKDSVSKIEIFPVHFAISDPNKQIHYSNDVLHRGLGGLAGFDKDLIWSGEYHLQILGKDRFHITANPKDKKISLDFDLEGSGRILSHGKDGYSVKSRKRLEIFSYYYSYPRLKTKGGFSIEGKKYNVLSGVTWMDHEWSGALEDIKKDPSMSYSLGAQTTGWDWICLSAEDGSDLVVFRFKENSTAKPETFGTYRDPDGKIFSYSKEGEVSMNPVSDEKWKSPDTKIEYPLRWNIRTPNAKWEVTPIFSKQEFDARKSTGTIYWEGMVSAEGTSSDEKKIKANGYLELKGYSYKKKWWEP